ncbi:MAG: hypothetical protein ACXVRZ_02950 [Gaiellaceae bacterium]
MVASEVTKRIVATYEAGDLITMCAWCRRVELDGEWLLAPRAALTSIDSLYTLSHSICPDCAAVPAALPSAKS